MPCLHYRRAKEKDELKVKEQRKVAQDVLEGTVSAVSSNIPCARIESVQENQAAHSLNGVQLRDYCTKLFHFKTVRLMRFKLVLKFTLPHF